MSRNFGCGWAAVFLCLIPLFLTPVQTNFLFSPFTIQQNRRISLDEWDVTQHLGTKTPYKYQQTSSPLPLNCHPIHFNFVARHGSREPTSSKSLQGLEKQLQKAGNAITNPDFQWMKNWTNPYINAEGELTIQGEFELYNMSKRYSQIYPTMFSVPYTPLKYDFRSTVVPRALRSAHSFAFGLFENRGELGPSRYSPISIPSESKNQDTLLRFFDNCPAYTKWEDSEATSREANKWEDTMVVQVAARVGSKLGLNSSWILTSHDISAMWSVCQYEGSSGNPNGFCSLFTREDVSVIEYWNDLTDYWETSYANPINYDISCLLLKDLFQTTQHAIDNYNNNNKTDPIPRANLRFAHAETILPLVSILGLFKDPEPLFANTTWWEQRLFQTSIISPFAANVAFVLYYCDPLNRTQNDSTAPPETEEFMLKLLHNEKELVFPGCERYGIYCPFSVVQQHYRAKLSLDFNKLCDLQKNTTVSEPAKICKPCKQDYTLTLIILIGVGGIVVGSIVVFVAFCFISNFRRRKLEKEEEESKVFLYNVQ